MDAVLTWFRQVLGWRQETPDSEDFHGAGTDIQHADMRTAKGGMHREFVVEVQDLTHLEKVHRAIIRVKGVLGTSQGRTIARSVRVRNHGRYPSAYVEVTA